MTMQKDYPQNEVNIFLMADAVTCALAVKIHHKVL
ncbi:MAG: hypothetical protein ACM339_01155 [Ignavibacteria bacterium]